jgi:hypothetical protein
MRGPAANTRCGIAAGLSGGPFLERANGRESAVTEIAEAERRATVFPGEPERLVTDERRMYTTVAAGAVAPAVLALPLA